MEKNESKSERDEDMDRGPGVRKAAGCGQCAKVRLEVWTDTPVLHTRSMQPRL